MAKKSSEFGKLLSEGVHRISLHESRSIQAIQDELGFALDRAGGSAIDFWRKGNVPKPHDIEKLAREIIRRSDLGKVWLERFLFQADYPHAQALVAELFLQSEQAKPSQKPTQNESYSISNDSLEFSSFVTGSPITNIGQFWGRERELQRLFSGLKRFPLRHMAIIGPQRSGKSSLLHYLRQITSSPSHMGRPDQRRDWLSQPERYRWVFVDFQDARMNSQARLFQHILQSLGLNSDGELSLHDFLDRIGNQVQEPTVLLFDEVGVALEQAAFDQSFWWSLRSLVTNLTEGRIACIVTSQRPPDQHAKDIGKPSPFFNIFYRLNLGPFQEQEARALIASSPIPFPAEDVEWIIKESACWPLMLQTLCLARLTALELDEADDQWRQDGLEQIARYRQLLEAYTG